jgi:hypothetical protein
VFFALNTAGYFLALMTNRTYILPPLHMTQNLWARDEKLANVKARDIMSKFPDPDEQRKQLKALLDMKAMHSTRQNRFIPLTTVFNKSVLESPVVCTDYMRQYANGDCAPSSARMKVIDFDDWLKKTGGHVNTVMVPNKDWLVGKCGKPAELWPKKCNEKHKLGGTKRALVRWDRPVIYDEVHCNTILESQELEYVYSLHFRAAQPLLMWCFPLETGWTRKVMARTFLNSAHIPLRMSSNGTKM